MNRNSITISSQKAREIRTNPDVGKKNIQIFGFIKKTACFAKEKFDKMIEDDLTPLPKIGPIAFQHSRIFVKLED